MVKQGYKQTEIGLIPNDWNIVSIEKLATDMSDGPFGSNLKKEHYTDDKQARIIQLSNIGENGWLDTNVKYTTFSHAKTISRCIVNPGHIIVAKMMPAGRAIICPSMEKMYVLGSDSIKLELNATLVNTKYFMYSTKSSFFQTQIKEETQGSTRARTSISKLRKNKVLLPSIEEQKRIAEALSDVDSMISSLEKLIAKKKAVKQGAMQELLTGKKRLPGFDGEWITKAISDIAIILDDHRIPVKESDREKMEGNIPYCGANGVLGYVNDYTIDDEIILIAEDGGYFDEYATRPIAYKMDGKCWVNNHAHIIKAKSCTNQEYLFYSLVHKDIRDFITSGTRSKLNKAELLKITITLPVDFIEQTAIASILSDMDNEIEALEQKLAKTRQIKQGMMQQLLTGKIRLTEEAVATSVVENNDQVATPKTQTNHNHQFDDAVMIAAVVNSFYSPKYRLGRKKVQKLLYLLRRKQEADTSAFKKKAAGPYADEVRYKGGEPIAKHNGYIETKKNNKGTLFFIGPKMASALEYIAKWQMQDSMDWLVKTFKYIGVEELELLATVDMAMCDLVHAGIEVSVDSIKQLIRSNEEWKAKLKKVTFSDDAIARAIEKCRELFGY